MSKGSDSKEAFFDKLTDVRFSVDLKVALFEFDIREDDYQNFS